MRKKFLWIGLSAAFAFALFLFLQADIFSWQALDLDRIRNYSESTVLYDANGEKITSIYATENREGTKLSNIPEYVVQAFITAEDQRFFEHNGIDIRRIFAALLQDIKTMSFKQGASTITQQLIKLSHLSGEKTISRKLREIVLALQLEKQMSKEEILEAYLNTVYFGNGAYGIATAAEVYFSKKVSDLSIAEGALLAGIIKSPSNYAPHLNPENALARRNTILKAMLSANVIAPAEYEAAVSEELKLSENASKVSGSWYTDAVLEEARTLLDVSDEEIMTGGYHIYTSYEPYMQQNIDELFANGANFPNPAADGTPVQAALIAMNPENGEIYAMAGGREYEVRRGLNRATRIQRQPGSAIKPVSTYAAAIEDYNFLPVSMINDVQREFPGKYLPGNAGGSYYGIVTLREALSRSLNVATVDLADLIGVNALRSQMNDFGLTPSAQDVNLSLALGSMTYGVSPADLCAAYCALSNGGMQVQAHNIRAIVDSEGSVLYECASPNRRAVKETTAFLITDMLKTAASSGSAKALTSTGIPIAGKTGTVGENGGGNRDIWTVAYTPEICVAVWMGFDQPSSEHSLSDNDGGSSYPARLCAAFIKSCENNLENNDFTVPEGLISAEIDRIALIENDTVMLAAENTPTEYVQTEWFWQNAVPETVSDLWNAPEAIDDLSLLPAEAPTLAFTSKSASTDYLVIKKDGESSEIAVILSADAGNVIVWCDTEADSNRSLAYSILPRHRLLYEKGIVLTGRESNTVHYSSENLLRRLFGS